MQFCVCAALLHAVCICCYIGKLVVHGLNCAGLWLITLELAMVSVVFL